MEAFVFPGQGSQKVGMGFDLYQADPSVRETFEQADEVLGFPLSKLCFEGPDDQLRLTEHTQPAILTVSVATWKAIAARGKRPAMVAGHSLGEYSALVAAGGLSFPDAIKAVQQRGRFMQEAVPVGLGAMAALLGLPLEPVEEVCREAAQGQVVSAANINSDDQIVIAGETEAVGRACELALKRGAKRAVRLPVSAPFHCALMLPAQHRLAAVLESISFRDLAVPLVNNAHSEVVFSADKIRQGLIDQVSAAVRWSASVSRMVQAGVTRFVEIGPGSVLSGLIRRLAPQAGRVNVSNPEQLESYVRL